MQVSIIGQFNWNGLERRSDRYGGIMLLGAHDDWDSPAPRVSLDPLLCFIGQRVKITARVLETRNSYHVGDLSRGIYPTKPDIGWVVELGIGTVRDIEDVGGHDHLLFQRDGRPDNGPDWMDPAVLYKLHCQTVELTIQETDEPAQAAPPSETSEVSGFTATVMPIGPSKDGKGTDVQMKVRLDHDAS